MKKRNRFGGGKQERLEADVNAARVKELMTPYVKQQPAVVGNVGTVPASRLMGLDSIKVVTMAKQPAEQLSQTAVLPMLRRQTTNDKVDTKCVCSLV